jgi:hypothetical protein
MVTAAAGAVAGVLADVVALIGGLEVGSGLEGAAE